MNKWKAALDHELVLIGTEEETKKLYLAMKEFYEQDIQG